MNRPPPDGGHEAERKLPIQASDRNKLPLEKANPPRGGDAKPRGSDASEPGYRRGRGSPVKGVPMFGPLAACAVTCAVAVTAAAALAASRHATVQPPVQPVAMGENIIWATAAAGTSALVQAWMRSPGHRANI